MHMVVSWNRGTLKSSISRWDFPFYSIINQPFWIPAFMERPTCFTSLQQFVQAPCVQGMGVLKSLRRSRSPLGDVMGAGVCVGVSDVHHPIAIADHQSTCGLNIVPSAYCTAWRGQFSTETRLAIQWGPFNFSFCAYFVIFLQVFNIIVEDQVSVENDGWGREQKQKYSSAKRLVPSFSFFSTLSWCYFFCDVRKHTRINTDNTALVAMY